MEILVFSPSKTGTKNTRSARLMNTSKMFVDLAAGAAASGLPLGLGGPVVVKEQDDKKGGKAVVVGRTAIKLPKKRGKNGRRRAPISGCVPPA